MSSFFPRACAPDIDLAIFINAGDPPLDQLLDLVFLLDSAGVACLELAVPFPDSVSDGEVVKRSSVRALRLGVGLAEVVAFACRVRPMLRHMRIALLADWSYTVRPAGLQTTLRMVAGSGADAVLLHGLPPRLRQEYQETASSLCLPVVASCYATSNDSVKTQAASLASAYLYLVARYGRSGFAPAEGYGHLSQTIRTLRADCDVPIAVGFGIRTRADLDAIRKVGADAAVIGSAFIANLEPLLITHRSTLAGAEEYLGRLMGTERSPHGAYKLPVA